MRKTIVIILATLMLLLAFTACGGTKSNETESKEPVASAEVTSAEESTTGKTPEPSAPAVTEAPTPTDNWTKQY